jgi:hypothetical protein
MVVVVDVLAVVVDVAVDVDDDVDAGVDVVDAGVSRGFAEEPHATHAISSTAPTLLRPRPRRTAP